MSIIENNKELKLENVLSLRKKMGQADVPQEMMKIGGFLKRNDIKKNGPIVTATFNIEKTNEEPILDMEILVPMDRQVELSGEYKLKKVFHLVNAVLIRHHGDPNLLQNTYNELMAYIKEKGLQQITTAYNVNIKDLQPGQSLGEMIIDVYIGVNPSIL